MVEYWHPTRRDGRRRQREHNERPPGTTQRQAVGNQGVCAGIWDSNGVVGGVGASIGGGTITTTNAQDWWTAVTVSLTPTAPGLTVSFTGTGLEWR